MSENTTTQNTQDKKGGWTLPGAKRGGLKAGLYIVGTPIGNLRDISLRALDVLAGVDGVLCEDTRVSGKLLKHYGIANKLVVYNDHSDDKRRAEIFRRIQCGEALALISDAGMPLISDPGYKLVSEMRAAGLYVSSVPGASAPLMALQLSGIPSDRFSFIGFLPSKSGARQSLLKEWADVPGTLIAFETAPRLLKALEDIRVVMGASRRVAVTRELTKMYEEVRCGDAGALVAHYTAEGLPKGEIVLVLNPPEDKVFSQGDVEALLRGALKNMSTKEAAAHVSTLTGQPKKVLYDLALKVSKS